MNSNTVLYYNRVVPVSNVSFRYLRYIVNDRRELARQFGDFWRLVEQKSRNWMSRTQLAFNSGDLAFQEIITSRPNRNSATRVVSLNAVWPVTATFPSMRLSLETETLLASATTIFATVSCSVDKLSPDG